MHASKRLQTYLYLYSPGYILCFALKAVCSGIKHQNVFCHHGGGGRMVGVLALHSDDLSSNPVKD